MGIPLGEWRMRIGCFSPSGKRSKLANDMFRFRQRMSSSTSGSSCTCNCISMYTTAGSTLTAVSMSTTSSSPSIFNIILIPVLAIITVLLVIGGVETNPGPIGSFPRVILKPIHVPKNILHGYGYEVEHSSQDQTTPSTTQMNNHLSSQQSDDDSSCQSLNLRYSASESDEGGMTDVPVHAGDNVEDLAVGDMTDVNDAEEGNREVGVEQVHVALGYMTDVNDVKVDQSAGAVENGHMTDIRDEDMDTDMGHMTDVNDVIHVDEDTEKTDVDKVGEEHLQEQGHMTDVGNSTVDHQTEAVELGHMTDVNVTGNGILLGSSSTGTCRRKQRVRFAEPLSSSDSEDNTCTIPCAESSDSDNDRQSSSSGPATCKRRSRIYPLYLITKMHCCMGNCVASLLETSKRAAKKARVRFLEMTLKEQADWIKSYLEDHHVIKNGKYVYLFVLGLKNVCRSAWMMVNGITRSQFYVLKREFEDGRILNMPANYHKHKTHMEKVNKSMTWLTEFAKEFGDKMPDSKNINLPSSLTKNDVYDRMEAELLEQGDTPCQKATFLKAWRNEHPRIVIPKQNRFSRCNKCTKYKLKLQSVKGKEKRKKIQEKRDKHIKFQNEERKKYYKHIFKAKKYPERYMSIIVDGMDQNTTSLPRPHLISKFSASMTKLTSHLVGVIVHGRGNHVYVDLGEIPQDSNTTCNLILQTLLKYQGQLPPVLYVQMDNTSRENKNRFVLGLFCALVELKIFNKVKVSFLPVGHTHEDVDQYFSRISVHLDKFSVSTLKRLLELIKSACPKIRTTAERLMNTFNIREWISPCLNPMQAHSYPHVFKFTRNNEGKAVMHTRMWASTGEEWANCSTDDGCLYLLRTHPDTSPKPLKPDLRSLKLPTILQDIKKAVEKRLMSAESLKEWKELILQLQEEERNGGDQGGNFQLYDLIQYNDGQEIVEDVQPSSAAGSDSSDSDPSPVVTLGKKRKRIPPKQIERNDMICVYNTEYATEWPQVGKVVDISDNDVTVMWYGQKDGELAYNPMFITKGKGKRIPYTCTMPLSCVVAEPFQLTTKRRLPKKMSDILDERFHDFFE